MLFDHHTPLKDIWLRTVNHLNAAPKDNAHPFRIATLSTINNNCPSSRQVVIRDVKEDNHVIFYTDARSEKVKQISSNPAVTLLFWDPFHQVQVVMEGKAVWQDADKASKQRWDDLPEHLRKPYTGIVPPAHPIDSPEEAHAWPQKLTWENFLVVTIVPEKFDILQLNGLEHIRARYEASEHWAGNWIAP